MLTLGGFAAEVPSSALLSSNAIAPWSSGLPVLYAGVAWGKPVNGLKVGISCNSATAESRKVPDIYFSLSNQGDHEIHGIIQNGAMCVVTVNGQHYAQTSWGGMNSFMPPGRVYGPIPIRSERLRKIGELQAWPSIDSDAPPPQLSQGTNTISLHYMLDKKLIGSGEIHIIAK